MDHINVNEKIISSIVNGLKEKGYNLTSEEIKNIVDYIKKEILFQYVDRLITQVESVLEIDHTLNEKEILQMVAKNIVEFLGAEVATLRIYDPTKEKMISFGSYPNLEDEREKEIPLDDSIAGEVIKTNKSYFVSSILEEEKYKHDKERMVTQGIHSMLAIPIQIPRFSFKDFDIKGVIQIYYKENNKAFNPIEAKIAEMLARRVSHVIALKRITDLQRLNILKDRIVEHIFLKLGKREGIKMKDVFNLVIPELADIMKIQRCSLFSVTEDRQNVVLEAGYPEMEHGIGKVFSIKIPYIDVVVNQKGPFGEFENEKIYPHYVLITNPQNSLLLPPDLKRFLEIQQIHSVLYIPLKVKGLVNYFLAFDAQAHHPRFNDEEIEIFTFFGIELMKGLRMEKMDDILHDFKNPAIAAAGFTKRVQKILQEGDYFSKKEKVDQALDIILKETTRIQELALTLHGEGKEEILDLSERLKMRFLINEEALKELGKENVKLFEDKMETPLWIKCIPLQIDRVLDNLLNNASKAIPEEGGELSIKTYREGLWAVAEISNTGEISNEDKGLYLLGNGRGRGLHITTRLIKMMKGKIEMEVLGGKTIFRVMLPLVDNQ